ncbi:VOC family protein [Synechococcus sp. CS-1324]|uniref:VOC family protein n=1 Tax=Synechococcus sp. CS-1324 TaxID=2847980 RepID=UPI00223B3BE6|nr:VOC family protein [Synechococcus sp. CS-1324]MCT0230070.1 VOC family protein [Synechococcus sp. CS-1324]
MTAATAGPGPHIEAVAITCSSAERSASFFCGSLGFVRLGDHRLVQGPEAALFGLPEGRLLRVQLQLGEERLDLIEVLDPGPGERPGRPLPPDSRSCDLWFQHLCLVTTDLAASQARLQPLLAAGVLTAVSEAPQRLPDWNTAAAGIWAYKFRDADGHTLELLQFPAGKGDPRWHRPRPACAWELLGIDHSAIAIADSGRSRAFYSDGLGLIALPSGENSGVEQDRLDGLSGAKVQITPLRCRAGMGIETLTYLPPNQGRPQPGNPAPQDLSHWQIRLAASNLEQIAATAAAFGAQVLPPGLMELEAGASPWTRGLRLADPDGHELLLLEAGGVSGS